MAPPHFASMAPPHFLTLLFVFRLLLPLSSAHFTPKDHLLLNCGSCSVATLPDGRHFLSDHGPSTSSITDPDSLPSTLYSTARIFRRPYTYKLQIEQGGAHILRLHFRPFLRLHSARFHVVARGSVLLHNLSFGCMEKDAAYPLIKEFILQLDPGELAISFVPVTRSDSAFVNAIEVVSVPGDLLPESATSVERGSLDTVHDVSKAKFETLYRINVGGAKVTPFNDTLWRTWVPDADFLTADASDAAKSVHFSGRIQYQKYGASREIAPDHVYNTARVLNVENGKLGDLSRNMSWAFEVPLAHRYFIRMHFCDIASLALDELYLDVFINGNMAYENLDISKNTNRILAAPYYADFVSRPDDTGRVTVTIAPSNMSREFKIHGLLNGLEIMKMSDNLGNLDGYVPASNVVESWKEGEGGFVPFLLCAILFSVLLTAGLMLVSRWRRASSRAASGWSLLPIDPEEGKFGNEILMTAGKTSYL